MSFRPLAPLLVAVLLGSSAALAGCATGGVQPVSYTDSAQQLYQIGLEELEGGDYMQAIATFEQVRNRYPYSQYAALAELRTGDAEFSRKRFLEAIDIYLTFVKLHPTHADVDWAAFRVGASHFESIPSDFFLFPSAAERDITESKAAARTLEDFITAYPQSKYVPEARKLLDRTLSILAGHEMAMGDFYASRQKWQGAAWRYEHLLRTYPRLGFDGEATFKLVRAYEKLEQPEAAAEALVRFLQRHPEGSDAEKAREALRSLGR